ncbi:MAG: hypothetical protein PUP92_08610 [Rhizonema sp. PD38]|nr:hypothetical protein [Rhizonema sp. PD38]
MNAKIVGRISIHAIYIFSVSWNSGDRIAIYELSFTEGKLEKTVTNVNLDVYFGRYVLLQNPILSCHWSCLESSSLLDWLPDLLLGETLNNTVRISRGGRGRKISFFTSTPIAQEVLTSTDHLPIH